MTVTALPVQSKILRESSFGTSFRELSASFGDGYSQVAQKGINSKYITYDIRWGNLTKDEFTQVISVLDSVGSWGTLGWDIPYNKIARNIIASTIVDSPNLTSGLT